MFEFIGCKSWNYFLIKHVFLISRFLKVLFRLEKKSVILEKLQLKKEYLTSKIKLQIKQNLHQNKPPIFVKLGENLHKKI